jgi:hypothetical protein
MQCLKCVQYREKAALQRRVRSAEFVRASAPGEFRALKLA